MPVQRCTKDGTAGYKWGEQGACFIGPGAQERAARMGRAIKAAQSERASRSR